MITRKVCFAFSILNCVLPHCAWALDVSIDGEKYSLSYEHAHLVAKSGAATIEGKKLAEDEDFSQWLFGDHDTSFELIYNSHTNRSIELKTENAGDAGGPYLIAAKGKYLLLDYGTAPGLRKLSLVDETGAELYRDDYIDGWPLGFRLAPNNSLTLSYIGWKPLRHDILSNRCHEIPSGTPGTLEVKTVSMLTFRLIDHHAVGDITCEDQ
jgi:hypothetical protein